MDDASRLQSAALNATVDGIVIVDASRTITWVNQSFETLTGYRSHELLGHSIEQFRPVDHTEAFIEDLWSTVHGGRPWSGEIINFRKDGTRFTSSVTVTPVRDESGATTHLVAVLRDITDAKRMQEQFLYAQKMEVVGRLAGSIAHDFNNLLGVINGTAELATMDLEPGSHLRADLDTIRRTGEKAALLTRQLLAFSRKQVIDARPIDLNDFVGRTQHLLQRLVGDLITIDLQPRATAPMLVADAWQLEQVLLNLVINARDAMPDGGRIIIRTRDAADGVALVVSDTGTGIDPGIRARIFEPFFTTKDASKGTGLGLSTVKNIVEDTGGRIEVQSRMGHGTDFTIIWQTQAATPAPPTPEPVQTLGTILVVEDDEAFLGVATRMLRRAGYTVVTARTAAEGTAVLEDPAQEIQLLLTDVILPGTGGPALADHAQSLRPDLPVVFMSGYPDAGLGSVALKAIESRLIRKPFSATRLLAMVSQTLSGNGGD